MKIAAATLAQRAVGAAVQKAGYPASRAGIILLVVLETFGLHEVVDEAG
jgi:hypothetical protein